MRCEIIILTKPKKNKNGHLVQKIYQTWHPKPITIGSTVLGGDLKGTVTIYKMWKLHSDPYSYDDVKTSQRVHRYEVRLEKKTNRFVSKMFEVDGWWSSEPQEVGSDYTEYIGYKSAKKARSEMMKWIKQRIVK
jgi:hypothetical protein